MTRSIDEPIRDWTYSEMWESGLELKLIGQWDNGRRARRRGLPNESQWKKDTLCHLAWSQGWAGESLDIQRTPAVIHQSGEQRTSDADSIHKSASLIRDVLAIDFLNLLVRCFHVGQPSDVHGVRGLLTCVSKVIRTLKPARVVFAADAGHAHRTELLPSYKAHRPAKPPELAAQIELAEQAFAAVGWPLIRVAGFEADDVLASIVKSLSEICPGADARRLTGQQIVIVSTDKDLLQLLPRCRVWNPFGDAGGWQSADAVRAKFGCELHQLSDWLALVGDSSDGIPGAAGIGEKTATKLLAEFGDIETAIAQAALGKIPGALGAKLKSAECWSQIEQARKLLSLVETLDVFETLEKSAEIEQPRAGWASRLQALRLFGAIKPLSEAFESLSDGGESQASPAGAPTAARSPRAVAKNLF